VRQEIWRALAQLRGAGLAMLVIDKYVQRLIDIGDRHCIVEKGRSVWQGTSRELADDRRSGIAISASKAMDWQIGVGPPDRRVADGHSNRSD
jgi:ABC-type multidrug transport system ATPase subunit